jgi:selenide,water dikinase
VQDRARRAAPDPRHGRPWRLPIPKALLVGIETSDDAAVYKINDQQAVVATTDFFMPIVDDPFDFGRIAATNAISDVYAMGGTPLFALALVGMPIDKLPVETIRRILEGGETVCAAAGIPIAGGHTIDSVEPIYGLVVIGVVDPKQSKRNGGCTPRRIADPSESRSASASTKRRAGSAAAAPRKAMRDALEHGHSSTTPGIASPVPAVHALTDVTGLRPHRPTCSRSAAGPM